MGVGLTCTLCTPPASLVLFTMKPQPLFMGMFSDSSDHLREAAFTASHLSQSCETPKYKHNNETGLLKQKRSQLWWGENQLPNHRRQLKTIRAASTQRGFGEAVRGRSQPRSSQRTPLLLASASRSVHPDCKAACAKDSLLA